MDMFKFLKGKKLETYIQFIYQMLLNLKDEGIDVRHNLVLPGKAPGCKHQIDVYYEFKKAGIIHKVAIECKGGKRPVKKSDVIDFHGKLRDLDEDISGILISMNGFQSGAANYAKYHNISLLNFDDLPHLGMVLGKRISAISLPDEDEIGEPFWTLMAIAQDNVLTGEFRTIAFQSKETFVPLFFSKHDAEKNRSHLVDKEQYAVRGLRQHHLGFYIKMMLSLKSKKRFVINHTLRDKEGDDCIWEINSPNDINEQYVIRNEMVN